MGWGGNEPHFSPVAPPPAEFPSSARYPGNQRSHKELMRAGGALSAGSCFAKES